MPNDNQIKLSRNELAQFLPTHKSIKAFEDAFYSIGTTLPNTIEEANATAATAVSAANLALGMLAQLVAALDSLLMAPAPEPQTEEDNLTPSVVLGNLSTQNYDNVDIKGGTIGLSSGTVALPSLYWNQQDTTGFYWRAGHEIGLSIDGVKLFSVSSQLMDLDGSIHVTGQYVSTVATGTAPLVVASATLVPNLYAARAALADKATALNSPTAFPADATDLPTAITLVNALKAAGVTKGL